MEDTTDSVIAYMAEFISENTFMMYMEPNLTLQITGMHERTFYKEEDIYNWCRGGLLNTYTHEEINITMIVNDVENATAYSDWGMHVSSYYSQLSI